MQKDTRLWLALSLCITLMLVEAGGGYLCGSLSLLSDAVHMLLDAMGFGVSLLAALCARVAPSRRYSFGLGRSEALGALVSLASLWLLSAQLFLEALVRCQAWWRGEALDIDGRTMFLIALLSLASNLVLGLLFHDHDHNIFHSHDHHDSGHLHDHCHEHSHHHDHPSAFLTSEEEPLYSPSSDRTYQALQHAASQTHHDIRLPTKRDVNVDAAYLHVLTDLLQSAIVAVCGLLIWCWPSPGLRLLDPLCTLVFCILVILSSIPTTRRVLDILLEGTPAEVDAAAVERELGRLPGVSDVHALHIWSLSSSDSALSCHMLAHEPEAALSAAHEICVRHGIQQATIQVQRTSCSVAHCNVLACV